MLFVCVVCLLFRNTRDCFLIIGILFSFFVLVVHRNFVLFDFATYQKKQLSKKWKFQKLQKCKCIEKDISKRSVSTFVLTNSAFGGRGSLIFL